MEERKEKCMGREKGTDKQKATGVETWRGKDGI